jgi:putative hemolysin
MAETAFSCLNKYRFEVKAEEGSRLAKQVLYVEAHFDTTLVTILIAINTLSVTLSVLSTTLFLLWLPALDNTLTSLIASVVLSLVLYLFGETLPKQIARKIPNKCAAFCVYPLTLFYFLLYPLSLVFRGVSFLAKKMVHVKESPELTEEDFTSIIETNEKNGLLEDNESDIIQASFSFSDITVEEVLTPKKDMLCLDMKGLSKEELAKEVCATKYSRIPMYYEDKNKIIGILIVKNYLSAYLANPNVKIQDYLERPYVVTPSITIDDMVDGFRNHHTQIALVYQDYKLLGMVTMEDVLEELVGDIGEKSAYVAPRRVRK